MDNDVPTLATLEKLVTSADIRDRAFAAGVLALQPVTLQQRENQGLRERIRETARLQHADLRRRIYDGTLDRQAFLAMLRDAPIETRDHLVEEILDIAYLPPNEIPRDVNRPPSGLAEILFAIDRANLDSTRTFVDLGSGAGKVVLLVALLTGARTIGIEIDPVLASRARAASQSLGRAIEIIEGDIRNLPLPPADVYYMYIPFIGSAEVVARLRSLAAERRILVFSQALPLATLPWLKPKNTSSYWLEMYES